MDEQQKWILLQQCLNEYYDEILNYMNLHIQNKEDAKDLTQEVYLLITKDIHTFQELSSLRTWCFSIAKNVVVSHYRKKGRLKKLITKIKALYPIWKGQNSFEEFSHLQIVLNAFARKDRDLVILKHYFGFSYKEISEITGLTESNVGVRINRAIKQLNSMEKEVEQNEQGREILAFQRVHSSKNKRVR